MMTRAAIRTAVGEGNHRMIGRAAVAMLMAGLTVLAGVSAPIAGARPTCQSADTKTICRTNGSVSIKSRPGTVAPPANQPVNPWLGAPGRRRGGSR